jgi:hypothetical protein
MSVTNHAFSNAVRIIENKLSGRTMKFTLLFLCGNLISVISLQFLLFQSLRLQNCGWKQIGTHTYCIYTCMDPYTDTEAYTQKIDVATSIRTLT